MDWAYTFLIVIAASMVQTGTGFGFAVFAIPLFLLLHSPHQAVLLSNMLSLVSALMLLPRIRHEVDKLLLKRVFAGSLIGVPMGIAIFYTASVFWMKVIVGITILMFTILTVTRYKMPLGKGRRVGFLSGIMASSVGMPGPPIVLYLASCNADKASSRGTTIAFYCLLYPFSIVLQYLSGHLSFGNLPYILLMIPAIFIGQAFGSLLHGRLSHEGFRKVTFGLLLVSAINTLVQTLGGAP